MRLLPLFLLAAACGGGSRSADGWSPDLATVNPSLLGNWGFGRVPDDFAQPQLAWWTEFSVVAGATRAEPSTWSGRMRTSEHHCDGLWNGTVRARGTSVRFEATSPSGPLTIEATFASSADGVDRYIGTMTWGGDQICLRGTVPILLVKPSSQGSSLRILVEWDAGGPR